jgi:transposase
VPVPIYIEISHLHRTATFIARGSISPDELRAAAEQLLDAGVPHYAKLIDVSGAVIDAGLAEGIATLMRARHTDKRGPMALLIDPSHDQFARAFAATQSSQRAVSLFTSLRQARDWLAQPHGTPAAPVATPTAPEQAASKPWSDPQRQAVMIRGTRRRDLAVGRRNRPVN